MTMFTMCLIHFVRTKYPRIEQINRYKNSASKTTTIASYEYPIDKKPVTVIFNIICTDNEKEYEIKYKINETVESFRKNFNVDNESQCNVEYCKSLDYNKETLLFQLRDEKLKYIDFMEFFTHFINFLIS
eukprot:449660_1